MKEIRRVLYIVIFAIVFAVATTSVVYFYDHFMSDTRVSKTEADMKCPVTSYQIKTETVPECCLEWFDGCNLCTRSIAESVGVERDEQDEEETVFCTLSHCQRKSKTLFGEKEIPLPESYCKRLR